MKIFERNCRSFSLIAFKLALVTCLYSCAGSPRKEARSTSVESSVDSSDRQKLQSGAVNIPVQNNSSPVESVNSNHLHETPTESQEPGVGDQEKLDISQLTSEKNFDSDEQIQPPERDGECERYFKNTVKSNISFPYAAKDLIVGVVIKLTSSHLVGDLKVTSRSGNPAFDAQVERGIRRAGEVPAVCPTDIFVVLHHDQKHLLGLAPVFTDLKPQKPRDNTLSAIAPSDAEHAVAGYVGLSPSELVAKNDASFDPNLKSKNTEDTLSISPAASEKRIKDSEEKNGVRESVEQAKTDKASALKNLDGDWYSYKWKYGYTLKDGIGYATITNTPNFEVGQEIVRLAAVSNNTFSGDNIYKDGKFYKVKVTLQADGKLLFEGEKNVNWTMERIKIADLVQIKQKSRLDAEASAEPSASDRIQKDEKISSRFNQKQFIQIVRQAQSSSRVATNDMQRGGVKAKRDKAICELARNSGGLNVSSWVGKIINLSANGDGKGVLGIELAPGISVKTWNNSLSDVLHHTLINPSSKLFEKASAMKVGQMVQFSGTFHPGSEPECVYEASITLNGKISEPEFIMTFSDIKKK